LAAEANRRLEQIDTPASSRKKRTASSPAKQVASKKPKSKHTKDGVKTVTRKKGKPKTSQTGGKKVTVNPEKKSRQTTRYLTGKRG